MEIHQKVLMPDYQNEEEKIRNSDCETLTPDTGKSKQEQWSRVERGLSGVKEEKVYCHKWKAKWQCSKGDQCSFGHERNDRAKPTPKAEPPSEPQSSKTRGGSVSIKGNARGRSQSEKFNRPPCKYFLKGTCTKSRCEYWHPPECQFYKTKSGCKFGAECSFPHWKIEEQANKKAEEG